MTRTFLLTDTVSTILTAMSVVTLITGCAKGDAMSDRPTSLIAVIDALRSTSHLDRAGVEHATGAKLTSASENSSFAFFEVRDVKLHDVTLSAIDYREPKSGGTATAGPLLNIKVEGCTKRADIEARYGPFQIVGAPRGRAPH